VPRSCIKKSGAIQSFGEPHSNAAEAWQSLGGPPWPWPGLLCRRTDAGPGTVFRLLTDRRHRLVPAGLAGVAVALEEIRARPPLWARCILSPSSAAQARRRRPMPPRRLMAAAARAPSYRVSKRLAAVQACIDQSLAELCTIEHRLKVSA